MFSTADEALSWQTKESVNGSTTRVEDNVWLPTLISMPRLRHCYLFRFFVLQSLTSLFNYFFFTCLLMIAGQNFPRTVSLFYYLIILHSWSKSPSVHIWSVFHYILAHSFILHSMFTVVSFHIYFFGSTILCFSTLLHFLLAAIGYETFPDVSTQVDSVRKIQEKYWAHWSLNVSVLNTIHSILSVGHQSSRKYSSNFRWSNKEHMLHRKLIPDETKNLKLLTWHWPQSDQKTIHFLRFPCSLSSHCSVLVPLLPSVLLMCLLSSISGSVFVLSGTICTDGAVVFLSCGRLNVCLCLVVALTCLFIFSDYFYMSVYV